MLNRGKGLLPSPRRPVDSSIIRLHPYHGLELDYLTSTLHTMVLGWAQQLYTNPRIPHYSRYTGALVWT